MTVLSVNVNKIALLRNSRGRDYPSVTGFVTRCLALGVKGITVHPRPDERHITRQDVLELSSLLQDFPEVEFNIEGYPSDRFLQLVGDVMPAQCTLVPDAPEQLTSDHGWDINANRAQLENILRHLRSAGIRSSLFLDADEAAVHAAADVKADRIELYTEDYARAFGTARETAVFGKYRDAAAKAGTLGVGVNAGHDLNLLNLPEFLRIPDILEVSIGHALVVESIEHGLEQVISRYLALIAESHKLADSIY